MTRSRPAAPRLDLRIDDLVIDGFAPGEGRAIAEAFERELGRLLASSPRPFGGPAGQDHTFDRLDAGAVTHAAGASPRMVGRSAARAVVQRLQAASAGQGATTRRNGP